VNSYCLFSSGEPLKLSVRQNRLHWDDIQFNMTVVGQFMYQISIGYRFAMQSIVLAALPIYLFLFCSVI
jgi:hypothetical protein